MGYKNTPRQESQVRTLKVMTYSQDWHIFSFKDRPQVIRRNVWVKILKEDRSTVIAQSL